MSASDGNGGSGRSATVNVQTVLPIPHASTATPIAVQAMRSRCCVTPRAMHARPAAMTMLL